MAERLRWGILATGNIARQFAESIPTSQRTALQAVGSRSPEAARSFATQHGIATAHGSYDALIADASVDAIYLSLPNSMHHEWTLKSLRAGKHVLCEKPFATNLAQSQEMFDVADKQGLLLVEAFMYRSHPLTHAVWEAVRGGMIGELQQIRTSFCYRTKRIDGNIRFDANLAGGSLMDIGCYCLSFARLFAGEEPSHAAARGHVHETGVDDRAAGVLHFPSGVFATFNCSMTTQADNTAHLCGTVGWIEIPIPWKPPPEKAEWRVRRGVPPRMDDNARRPGVVSDHEVFSVSAGMGLYALEADDFAAAVAGEIAPAVSKQDTLGNMNLLDELRRQVGVRF